MTDQAAEKLGYDWAYNPLWFMPGGRMPTAVDEDLTVSDWFCGAGGSTDGAVWAGVRPRLASNHWPIALENHALVHPTCDHHLNDLVEASPGYFRGSWGAWFSPACVTWSQARGRRRNFEAVQGALLPEYADEAPLPTEAEQRSRATMETVVRYSRHHRYCYVIVENVVDVMEWAEIERWYREMEAAGYRHRTLYLNAMFFAVPQSRDRVYVVFWREDVPEPKLDFRPPAWCPKCERSVAAVQSWKKRDRQRGRYREQYLYRCPRCAEKALPLVPPALSVLDLSLPIQRIGDRAKPLADATMRRIAWGARNFWGWPFNFDTCRDPKFRDASAEALPTQTGRQSLAVAYYLPLVVHLRGTAEAQVASSATPSDGALRTITGGGFHHGLLTAPPLVIKGYGDVSAAGPMSLPANARPLGAITGIDHHGLVTPPLTVQAAGNTYDGGGYYRIRPAGAHPLWTLPATATSGLVTPSPAFLASYYKSLQASRVEAPMPALTGHERHSLVEQGPEAGSMRIEDCGFRMLDPYRELKPGMGFLIDRPILGSKRVATQLLGQAVCPEMSMALWAWCRAAYHGETYDGDDEELIAA